MMKPLLKVFLVCLLCLTPTHLSAGKQEPQLQQSDGNNIKTSASTKIAAEKILTGSKAWAIGCSAVLIERNHEQLDTLATRQITKSNVDSVKELLDTFWGIKSNKDLMESLSWLETGGHRRQFDQAVFEVTSLSDEQFKILAGKTGNYDGLQKIQLAREYGKKLSKTSILGWDYCRYIAVCRWGYTAGYISEEDAWAKIMPVARELQKTFNSWEGLACNFIIGRQFWSYKETLESGPDIEDAVVRLLDMPSSPWNKYPWNMNLDLDNDANDTGKK